MLYILLLFYNYIFNGFLIKKLFSKMEVKNFQEKLHKWAISLGFRLPDGSIPSADYFTSLTLTPHRRQLWEAVIEAVQPRYKVEQMRKQILVAKLQNKKIFSKNELKNTEDRIELWEKQNKLKSEVEEKRMEVDRLEKSLMVRAEDTLFQLDILAELEKQLSEMKEKTLFLKLFKRQISKISDDLLKGLSNIAVVSAEEVMCEKVKNIGNELLNMEACKNSFNCDQDCCLSTKINEFCNSGVTEQHLWEEVINCKKDLLENFSGFLDEFISVRKNIFSEKEAEIERKKNQSIVELKQKITEKSMEVTLNATEEKLLELEVEKLVEKVFRTGQKDASLNETFSFVLPDVESSHEEKENLRKYLNLMGLKKYEEFLKEELQRLEENPTSRKNETKDGEEAFEAAVEAFESAIEEIMSSKTKEEKATESILKQHDQVQSYLRVLKEETEDKTRTQAVEEVAEKLSSAPEKQIERFLDTPIDAFRTFESSSGRMSFKWESQSHRLKNYAGDSKSFCPAMLIPPVGDVESILSEINRRKIISNKLKNFISEREKLAALEKEILEQLKNMNYDERLCEKNFIQSQVILENIRLRTEDTAREMESIEKILKSWLEQPFRFMIRRKDISEHSDQFK